MIKTVEKTFCDICGRELTEPDKRAEDTERPYARVGVAEYLSISHFKADSVWDSKDLDLCRACYPGIKKALGIK